MLKHKENMRRFDRHKVELTSTSFKKSTFNAAMPPITSAASNNTSVRAAEEIK
jgi:hypothetical protein